jgi:hypothetical protein
MVQAKAVLNPFLGGQGGKRVNLEGVEDGGGSEEAMCTVEEEYRRGFAG